MSERHLDSKVPYIGRFAPSPTGPLHFGSLFAAVISYLHAKKHNGKWQVRIEDIDPLREQEGASSDILRTLEAHGLYWDGEVTYQSARSAIYEEHLSQLRKEKLCFYCPCSRKQLTENKGQHTEQCKNGSSKPIDSATKFAANHQNYTWTDEFQSECSGRLNQDFVLKRKEGFYSYQLAVVADDTDQGITHVIRGYDLIDSTPMQLALYKSLRKTSPYFAHFPIISHEGQKLSKQNLAPAIESKNAFHNLRQVFSLLGISNFALTNNIEDDLNQAITLWDPQFITNKQSLNLN